MRLIVIYLICFIALNGCEPGHPFISNSGKNNSVQIDSLSTNKDGGKGGLLLTKFRTLDELKEVVQITYEGVSTGDTSMRKNKKVCLTNRSQTQEVTSTLELGISEADFTTARKGSFWDRALVVVSCPYVLFKRKDLMRVEILGRRRYMMFGKGDVAFYDLAETMVQHIADEDLLKMNPEDFSEKGYLNTFNHIMAQAFMTTLYSEKTADFIADVHERHTMPELVTGIFTETQLADLEKGPVDNYVDMINNEWGQELGKYLRNEFSIHRNTCWTPELLANYLNAVQSYHSWVFEIGFKPFSPEDEIVIRFANKINDVNEDVIGLVKLYN